MTSPALRIALVGATSAIAAHCARLWLQQGASHLTLIGRDAARLERLAADLRTRQPAAHIDCVVGDFADPVQIARQVESICQDKPLDVVLIAHGSLPVQAECEGSLEACQQALVLNGVSPVLYAEAFARQMATAGRGSLAVIGSVAGDRGRKSNYVYGAAKGLVDRYLQGLQHRFAGSNVQVVLIKPGPVDTPMTAHLKGGKMSLAPVEQVAAEIVAGIARGQPVIYTPKKWWLIMMVVKHLPRFVFNRMNV